MNTLLITVIDGLAFGLLLFIMALGLSLVFGVMDVLNLAHGAVFLIGAYAAVSLTGGGDASLLWFVVAAIVAALIGGVLGLVLNTAVKPISARGHLDQALLTLGVALVIADLISMQYGNDVQSVPAPPPINGSVAILGGSYPVYRLVLIALGILLAVVTLWAFDRTRLGSLVRAAVVDAQMVRAIGVDTGKLVAGVFVLGSALAGFAGAIGTPLLSAYPGLDNRVLLFGLVIIVLGGLGSVSGALVGALIIGQIEVLGAYLAPEFASFFVFGAMGLVLLLRPQGLLGQGKAA